MRWKILLTLLSAVLVVLVFPPIGWWFLAPVAWVPLLMALKDTGLRASFRLGVLHGFVSFGATLWWLLEIFATFAPVLWMMLALFTGLFGMACHFAHRFQTKWLPVIIATLWTGIEYYRSELFVLDFPWITPGTGFPPNFLTPIIGVYGVSFFIFLMSMFLIQGHSIREKNNRLISSISFVAVFVILAFGLPSRHHQIDLKIALIQNEEALFDTHYEMSEPLAGKVDAIVWPEYAVPFDPNSHPQAKPLPDLLVDRTEVIVLGGRKDHEKDFHNTAFTQGKAGPLGHHVKNHTVHLFADGIRGTTAEPIDTPLGKIGTPICFDCDYQDVIRKMTAKGAAFFLIPIMDAESWTARQHLQHAELFRHRAAENGRWLAIAATSGQTQIIAPNGEVTAAIPLMKPGVLTGTIQPLTHLTLFQRGGWLFGPICFAALFVLLALSLLTLHRRRKSGSVSSTNGGSHHSR